MELPKGERSLDSLKKTNGFPFLRKQKEMVGKNTNEWVGWGSL